MIKIKARTARVATASIVVLLVLLGIATKTGYGTVCSLGTSWITFTCPLGFLQIALASRNPLPQLWLSVALVLLSIVILGRFFCAWICPTALLRSVFRRPAPLDSDRNKRGGKDHATTQLRASASSSASGPGELSPKGTIWASYSRYAVLGGTLISSFLFGFPVFCAICPIGLFFGSLFALSKLLAVKQPSLELLLFPALLGIELLAFRSWCRNTCPLGALLSIISDFNRVLRPVVKKDACLVSQRIPCQACEKACPEGINLLQDSSGSPLRDCTKCLECYEKCPAKAIELAL